MKKEKGFLTIGYGGLSIEDFIKILKDRNVNCIVDIRSRPYSKKNKDFNKESLREYLMKNDIFYEWYGKELGGRSKNKELYNEKGIIDYDKISQTESFKDGISKLDELSKVKNVCVMCTKEDPSECHRFYIVSRAFKGKGYKICHLLKNNSYISNDQLEEKMAHL